MYNMTILQNATNMYGLMNYANTSASNMLFPLLIISIFIIMLLAMFKYGFDNALLVSSWSCFIISMFMNFAKLIPLVYTLAFLAVASLTLILMEMFN